VAVSDQPATWGPVKLLVLQGTGFCNINCRYCYLPDRSDRTQMSVATVEAVAGWLLRDALLSGPLLVNWHAGEPLVLRPEFYRDRLPLFDVIADSGIAVTHSLQTNATLVTDKYCELFAQYAIRVGVSIDGPAFIHDSRRVTRSGRPTHAKALAGIRKLQQHGIPFNVICVLSDVSLRHPDQMYSFFRDHDIRAVGFNLEEIEGANRTSSLATSGFDDLYRSFLHRFWELVEQDDHRIRVREFDDGEGRILDLKPRRNSQTEPFVNLTVGASGDFSTFSPELLGTSFPRYPSFTLGNVHDGGFKRAVNSPRFQQLWGDIRRGVEACRDECGFFDVCGGGNPSNKIAENGDASSTETLNCRARIKITSSFLMDIVEQRIAAVTGR